MELSISCLTKLLLVLGYRVPVKGALDNDLEIWLEGLKQTSNAKQLINGLLPELNLDLIINDTE